MGSVLRRVTITCRDYQIRCMRIAAPSTKSAMSLMELLCVIAIIGILAALYLGAIARAFRHILKFLNGF